MITAKRKRVYYPEKDEHGRPVLDENGNEVFRKTNKYRGTVEVEQGGFKLVLSTMDGLSWKCKSFQMEAIMEEYLILGSLVQIPGDKQWKLKFDRQLSLDMAAQEILRLVDGDEDLVIALITEALLD